MQRDRVFGSHKNQTEYQGDLDDIPILQRNFALDRHAIEMSAILAGQILQNVAGAGSPDPGVMARHLAIGDYQVALRPSADQNLVALNHPARSAKLSGLRSQDGKFRRASLHNAPLAVRFSTLSIMTGPHS